MTTETAILSLGTVAVMAIAYLFVYFLVYKKIRYFGSLAFLFLSITWFILDPEITNIITAYDTIGGLGIFVSLILMLFEWNDHITKTNK